MNIQPPVLIRYARGANRLDTIVSMYARSDALTMFRGEPFRDEDLF